MKLAALIVLIILTQPAIAAEPIRLVQGYVYKVRCEGRLLVSAIGNETLIRLEALPREVGCGAVLKPLAAAGSTNLILETSTGTVTRLVEIEKGGRIVRPQELDLLLRSETLSEELR